MLPVGQDHGVGTRSNWKQAIVVFHEEASSLEYHLKLLVLQCVRVNTAQDRKEDLVIQDSRRRVPIHVEVGRIHRSRAVFEQIHPPGIFRAGCHVIWHDIEQQPQTVFLQIGLKSVKLLLAAQVAVNARRISGIVAVAAAAAALQQRRSIDVRDAEPREVVQNVRGIVGT